MGERLKYDPEDPFFNFSNKPIGVCGGCYCCGQQINVSLNKLDILPVAKIKYSLHYILICDSCENDIEVLKESGIPKVSYDVLFYVQKNLKKNVFASIEERSEFLKKLYLDIMKEKNE